MKERFRRPFLVPICPYCMREAERVQGDVVYKTRPDLKAKWFWLCRKCWAYVGCHPGTDEPMGRLANRALRTARNRAHAAFDPIWKHKHMSRVRAYAWLADKLGILPRECHIAMFNETQCRQAEEACRRYTGTPSPTGDHHAHQ